VSYNTNTRNKQSEICLPTGHTALRDIGQERSGFARPLRGNVRAGANHSNTGFPAEDAFVPDLDNVRQRSLRGALQHQQRAVAESFGRTEVRYLTVSHRRVFFCDFFFGGTGRDIE